MKKTIIVAVILCVCCALVLSGCSMEQAIDNMLFENGEFPGYDTSDSYEAGDSFAELFDNDKELEYAAEEPAEYDESYEESIETPMLSDPLLDSDLIAGNPSTSDGTKMVYTANVSMSSTEFDKDYGKIRSLLKSYGGYIEYENMYGTPPEGVYDIGRSVMVDMRVPADNYDAFLDDISGIGTIESKEARAEDVSATYYDTDSRIELLEERKDRLMKHLEEATKMEDIITLEDEISDVIYQLDDLKGQKRGLDNEVEYSRISLEITEYQTADDAVMKEDIGLDPGNAFNTTLKGMGEFFRVLGVMLAAAAPVLILIGVVVAVVLIVVHAVRRSAKKKERARTEIK